MTPSYPYALARSLIPFDLPGTQISQTLDSRRGDGHLVAIPLHLARRLSATLSPRRRCRAFPLTVATCLTGSNVSPSWMCHSTLQEPMTTEPEGQINYILASELAKDFGEERDTSKHSGVFTLSKEECFSFGLPDHISCVVERRRVLGEPSVDL